MDVDGFTIDGFSGKKWERDLDSEEMVFGCRPDVDGFTMDGFSGIKWERDVDSEEEMVFGSRPDVICSPSPDQLLPPSVVSQKFHRSHSSSPASHQNNNSPKSDMKCSNEDCPSTHSKLEKQDCGHWLCEGCSIEKEMSHTQCPKCEKENASVKESASEKRCKLCGVGPSTKDPLRKCQVDGEIFCGVCAWVHQEENGDEGEEHKLFSLRDQSIKDSMYAVVDTKFQKMFATFTKLSEDIDEFTGKVTKTEVEAKIALDRFQMQKETLSREKFEEQFKNLEFDAVRVLDDMKHQLSQLAQTEIDKIGQLIEEFLPTNVAASAENGDESKNAEKKASTNNNEMSNVSRSSIDNSLTFATVGSSETANSKLTTSKPKEYEKRLAAGDACVTSPLPLFAEKLAVSVQEAGAVLCIIGLDMRYFDCERVFNLLCQYGDVMGVKFMYKKEGHALVQMKHVAQAEDCIQNLNGCHIFSKTVNVIKSSVPHLILDDKCMTFTLSTGDSSVRDFSADGRHRFRSHYRKTKNLKLPPDRSLHFWNMPRFCKEKDVEQAILSAGASQPARIVVFKNDRGLNSSVGIATFRSVSEAIHAIVLANHTPCEGGRSLNLSFAKQKENYK